MWAATGNRDLMIKPLFFESEVFGYLIAGTDERERAMIDDLRLMISVTLKGESLINELQQTHAQLEWALHAMKKVNRQLSDISLRDDLTGLLNRRGFIQETVEYLETEPDCYLLGFADMNGLKAINDQFGHEEGDAALRAISDILRHCSREVDILARISGDEFAFVIKDLGWAQKEQMELRFEEKLDEWNRNSGKGYLLSFARGYSVGRPGMALEHLMQQSDARMYVHKAQQKAKLTIIRSDEE
jgi:diguanylate cyclase (GGDEF)-like protein